MDCIGLGECEKTICDFLHKISIDRGRVKLPDIPVEGFVFKRDGRRVGSFLLPDYPSIDEIGFPDKAPFYRHKPYASLEYMTITSRGCPFSCSFCFNSSPHFREKHKYMRRRSVGNVISELEWAKTKFSIRQVFFYDDSFTYDKDWLLHFCSEYKIKINLPFSCQTHPMFIDDDVAIALKQAGCSYVQMGIQSVVPDIRRNILNRKGDISKIAQAIKCLKMHRFIVYVDHLIGIPGDTLENQEECALFYNEIRPSKIGTYWLVYYPELAIVQKAHEMGVLSHDDLKTINSGKRLTENGFFSINGDVRNPERFYGIAFVINWLPFLPKGVVRWLIRTGRYRKLNFSNYFLSIAIPNTILCLLPRNYRARRLVARWFRETLDQLMDRISVSSSKTAN